MDNLKSVFPKVAIGVAAIAAVGAAIFLSLKAKERASYKDPFTCFISQDLEIKEKQNEALHFI